MRTTIKFFQGVVPCAGVLPAGTILEVLPHWRNQNLLLFKKKPHRLRRLSDRWRSVVRWSHINLYRYGLTGHCLASKLRRHLKPSVERRAAL